MVTVSFVRQSQIHGATGKGWEECGGKEDNWAQGGGGNKLQRGREEGEGAKVSQWQCAGAYCRPLLASTVPAARPWRCTATAGHRKQGREKIGLRGGGALGAHFPDPPPTMGSRVCLLTMPWDI